MVIPAIGYSIILTPKLLYVFCLLCCGGLAPATPAVQRTRPTIVSTPNAIIMTLASGDEYSNEEENIDEVALDLSTSFLC